jgi:hypothetical protein
MADLKFKYIVKASGKITQLILTLDEIQKRNGAYNTLAHICDADRYHQILERKLYSGFNDSKGTEIYEGDQLNVCAGYTSIVIFKDGMFQSEYHHFEDGETLPLCDVIGKDTVVIANDENDDLEYDIDTHND